MLNQSLGIAQDTADNESIDNAAEILKIVPTIDEISDFDREKEMVLDFIAQYQNRFVGALSGSVGALSDSSIENNLPAWGKFANDFVYMTVPALQEACNKTGFNYSKVVADLVEGGFFIPADSVNKGYKNPRPFVNTRIGAVNPRCYRIPRAFFDGEE